MVGRVWPSLSGAMRSLHCSLAKSVTRVRRLYLTLRTPLSRIPYKSWLVFILDLKSYVLLGERWAGHPCCSSLLSPSSWTSLALLKKDCSFALLSLTFMHRRFGLPTLFFQVIILSSLSVCVDELSSAP